MISPFRGRFRVSQIYKGAPHKGLDLVAIDDTTVYSTVNGTIIRAGWENPKNHSRGWGIRVVIRENDSDKYFYYGHLQSHSVKVGESVNVGDKIGTQGNTGKSTGDHLHYECRIGDSRNFFRDVSYISGIPNRVGIYGGENTVYDVKWLQTELNNRGYTLVVDGILGVKTTAAVIDCLSKNKW